MSGTEVRRRQHQVCVRLLPEEVETLRMLAERDGVSPPEVLRRPLRAVLAKYSGRDEG